MENKRQLNIEVLRVLSMFLVVTGHYVYWGLKVRPEYNPMLINSVMDWINYLSMEAIYIFSCIGVNVFVMISGYFLIDRYKFRWKSLVNLWLTTVFYSLSLYLIFDVHPTMFFGGAILLLPIYNQTYWFVTIYFGLMLIAPYLSKLASTLTKKQYQLMLLLLFIINFEFPYGMIYGGDHSLMWFVFLYLSAGYIKLYGVHNFLNKHSGLLSVVMLVGLVASVAIYCEVIDFYAFRSNRNNGLMYILSLLVFISFVNKSINNKAAQIVAKCSPYLFAIYLIHQHPTIMESMWQWLIPEIIPIPFALHCIIVCFSVCIACIVIDVIRALIFKVIKIDKIGEITSLLPQNL